MAGHNMPALVRHSASTVKAMRDMGFDIQITRVREARLRLWIAIRLIKLASWFLGCAGVTVEQLKAPK